MKLTKTEGSYPGQWIVRANGRDTGIRVCKGCPPRYREPQEWDVVTGDGETYLFSARSLGSAMAVLSTIVQATSGDAP